VSADTGRPRRPFAIEPESGWRIWALFFLLVALAFGAFWALCVVVSAALYLGSSGAGSMTWVLTARGVVLIFAAALTGAALYWSVSRLGARERLLGAMHCRPLDPGDSYHRRLADVVEELRIASGSRGVECVTVATLGLNAFAFSDLHGGGVVGVTEGALARLSRPQLQAVVAHEFGHVASGSWVTATVSCLLFGIHSALGDRLEEAAAGTGSSLPVLTVVGLRGWLWLLRNASAVTSTALGRERERRADLAAVRYTRDPLSLAEALRVISRHPRGAGFIPDGLAPLCIREAAPPDDHPRGGWKSAQPSIDERIGALLAMAAASPDRFARQVDEAEEHLGAREHWSPAPAPGTATAPATRPAPAAVPVPLLPELPLGSRHASAPFVPRAAACPSCGSSLSTAEYEGLRLTVCPECGGRLVAPDEVDKLLARRETAFTPEQTRLAAFLAARGDELRRTAAHARGRLGAALLHCPSCGRSMVRRHYDYDHAVEVDFCSVCELYWFERDELEALQILAERQSG
jgi:Zn-dependent protease with chaperone function/Zn-finger nucleic acid-binding protein